MDIDMEVNQGKMLAPLSEDSSTDSNCLTIIPGVYYPKNKSTNRRRKTFFQEKRRNFDNFVSKNGDINIERPGHHSSGIFCNWFVNMVEAPWRWTLLHFFASLTGNWLIFGYIYWVISYCHGDLVDDHLPQNQSLSEWVPCVENIYGFTSSFLFSIEVHTTVAYGKRSITLECPQAIITMCLQCIVSSVFQSFLIGILFAKLTRPKSRTQTILFSRYAVINMRDNQLCLMFRVGDIRKSRILNIKAYAFILRMAADQFDNYVENEQIELKLTLEGCDSTFFLWPISVVHVIDEDSPLYRISAGDLLCGRFEMIVAFEGTIESTGQMLQARYSFDESDILWGHRFVTMVDFDADKDMYNVDFSCLGETEQIDTPLCSASEYKNFVSEFKCNYPIIER